jgi:ABC-type polysaccharide/polyol phosphate export permease
VPAVQHTFTHKQYTEYSERNIHNNKKIAKYITIQKFKTNCYCNVFLLLCIVYHYVMYSFVSVNILIVMCVPFCVFCLIVFFSLLFVRKCVLCCRHRDIGSLLDYSEFILKGIETSHCVGNNIC